MTPSGPETTPLLLDAAGFTLLVDRLTAHARRKSGPRAIVGLAGIPGSGKSTLASRLLAAVQDRLPGAAALLPMDGFHHRNAELEAMGLRDRKGAPQTFNARGYIDLLAAARALEFVGPFPVYDRELHEPVWRDAPGQRIDRDCRLILTEGNYLLLEAEPWGRLASVLDEAWLLDTPVQRAHAWLIDRYLRGGRTRESAQAHYERSDTLNIRLICECSRRPDLRLTWDHSAADPA